MKKTIKTALISVFDKTGLEPLIRQLNDNGVQIYSTGGTFRFIEEQKVSVKSVEDLTGYPSILDGRVKTLHPKVFGGILSRSMNENDQKELQKFEIPVFDLVIVDLYPFSETVKQSASNEEIIEKIDIGGISLIRAAAKNHQDVLVVSSKNQYSELTEIISKGNETTVEQRKKFAAEAFQVSANYDSQIQAYLSGTTSPLSDYRSLPENPLRYGENPHQTASFYGELDKALEQIHGKELSFNNLVDIDAALNLVNEFSENTFVVIKHTNPCGLATDSTSLLAAWEKTLAGDPVSAFGGIIACNSTITTEVAEQINKLFFEVLIAPSYDSQALEILKQKKKRILIKSQFQNKSEYEFKSLLNGYLLQQRDLKHIDSFDSLEIVTEKKAEEAQMKDLLFANKIVKHTKSNAIVLVKDSQLIGLGTGQTSRVDALNQAISKTKAFKFELRGASMASDAFFPFNDCVEIAATEGISAIIQPGGSIRDQDSIDSCNKHQISMAFTSTRHFKH